MNDIRIIPEEDFDKFFDIFLDAYPGIHSGSADEHKKLKENFFERHTDERISLWGLYRDGELLGGLRLFDYQMNVHGTKMLTGGGGCLAVSLLHKKESVAKELMQFFFRHYRDRGSPLTLLWSFRPDFYKNMGCGLGTKIHLFETTPDNLPRGESKEHVRFLADDDLPGINDCYNRFVDNHHGMIEETLLARRISWDQYKIMRHVGYVRDGRILGYLTFRFVKGETDSFVDNILDVFLAIYQDAEVLSELLTFLHTQFDQIGKVRLRTFDDTFCYLLKDPRNMSRDLIPPVYHETHKSGTGIMYRIVDSPQFFKLLEHHDFAGQTIRVKLNIADSFLPENDGTVLLHFENGKVQVMPEDAVFDVGLSMGIADFSSLAMGAIDLKSLYKYGLASLSDATYLDALNRIFASDRPICITSF